MTDIILTTLLILKRYGVHKDVHKIIVDYLYETITDGNKKYQTINGIRHGMSRSWYENGQLWVEGEYKNGKQDGMERIWYDNSQLWYKLEYKNGEPDEMSRSWLVPQWSTLV